MLISNNVGRLKRYVPLKPFLNHCNILSHHGSKLRLAHVTFSKHIFLWPQPCVLIFLIPSSHPGINFVLKPLKAPILFRLNTQGIAPFVPNLEQL